MQKTQANKDKAENIEQVAQDGWQPSVTADMAEAVRCSGNSGLQGMVYPFADADEHSAAGKQHQGGVGDDVDILGEGYNKKNKTNYQHGFIPIVNDELRQRVAWFHLSLLFVFVSVRGCRKYYLEQAFFARILTSVRPFGYAYLVAGIPAAGFCSPNEGGHAATSVFLAVFLCPLFMALLLWVSHVGSRKARRSFVRSANLHGLALFAFCSVRAGKIPIHEGVMS